MDVREKLVEQAISHFWYGISHDIFSEPVTTYAKLAIEALKKDNGVTVQEWISVKDRLPEEDGEYLVFEKSNGRTNTSILRFAKDARKVDRYDFKCRWKNAWYGYDSEWGHYTVNSVTHWQYLPQPPKGE